MKTSQSRNKFNSFFNSVIIVVILGFSNFAIADETIIIPCEDNQSIDPGDGVQLESNQNDSEIELGPCGGGSSYGGGIGWVGTGGGTGGGSGTGSGNGDDGGNGDDDAAKTKTQCLKEAGLSYNSCIQNVDALAIVTVSVCAAIWESGPGAVICLAYTGVKHTFDTKMCNDIKVQQDAFCESYPD